MLIAVRDLLHEHENGVAMNTLTILAIVIIAMVRNTALHTIRENQIDELVENEVKSLRDSILAESDKYDKIVRDWLRKKPLY